MKLNTALPASVALSIGILLLTPRSFAQQNEPQVGDTKEETLRGFLCDGSNGIVRVGQAHAVLGMFSQWAGIIEHRLGAGLINRFAPLINHVDWLRGRPRPDAFYGGFGTRTTNWNYESRMPSSQSIPTLLVDLKVKMRLVEKSRQKEFAYRDLQGETMPGPPHWIYEIQQAELVQAEEISPVFLKAWRDLDAALHGIVETSLEPATPAKRARLAEILEQGSHALNTMTTQKVTQAFRDAVRPIEPTAHVTRRFQFEGPQQWREQLELYSAKLGIAPKTPIPVRKEYPIAKWIQESESLEAMLRTVWETGDDDVWLQRIPFPVYWYRNGTTSYNLPISQLPNLARADFERLREEARKPGAKFVTNFPTADSKLADPTKPIASAELGVVLKPADTNLLMRHLLLAGWVVDERLPDGPDKGLAPGDLLPGYNSVYDMVMARWDWSVRRSLNLGEQKVFRGDKVFTVQGAK